MLKFICDRCGSEFTAQFSFCEVVTKDRRDVMLPPQKGQPQIMPATEEKIYHLCQKCRNEIIGGFKPEK